MDEVEHILRDYDSLRQDFEDLRRENASLVECLHDTTAEKDRIAGLLDNAVEERKNERAKREATEVLLRDAGRIHEQVKADRDTLRYHLGRLVDHYTDCTCGAHGDCERRAAARLAVVAHGARIQGERGGA